MRVNNYFEVNSVQIAIIDAEYVRFKTKNIIQLLDYYSWTAAAVADLPIFPKRPVFATKKEQINLPSAPVENVLHHPFLLESGACVIS